jgi:cellulose synthase operon protein C
MNDICGRVHEFADGELIEESAGSFEWHLAACSGCQGELESILAIRALALESLGDARSRSVRGGLGASAAPRLSRAQRARRIFVAATPVLVAASFALVLGLRPRTRPDTTAMVAQAFDALGRRGERPTLERLAHAGADRHRPPPRVMRGGGAGKVPPSEALLRLEEAGDQHGLATLHVATRDLDRAETVLAQLPSTPEVENDRAVLEMKRGRLDAAEVRLRGVLRARPDQPAALWNLALLQEQRGDRAGASRAFAAIAARGEPGWSVEARRRADDLAAP